MCKRLLVFLLFLFLSSTAQGQVYFGANGISKHSMTLRAVGFSAGVNYNYKWDNTWLDRDVNVQVELIAPIFLASDLDSWLLEASFGTMLLKNSVWNMGFYIGESGATASNILGRYFSTSENIAIQPGYYRSNWYVAADLRILFSSFTYIRHSERQKSFFDDIPKSESSDSSVLRFPNSRFLLGAIVSYTTVSKKWTFVGAGGALVVPQSQGILVFPEVNLLPIYFTIDIARHF